MKPNGRSTYKKPKQDGGIASMVDHRNVNEGKEGCTNK